MKILGIITTLFLLVSTGCKPAEQKKPMPARQTLIKMQPVHYMEYKNAIRVTGLLHTTTEMKLSFKTGGIINKIHVKEGVSVSRGDVLAVLDLSEIKAQVSQARIGLEKARRDLSRAENLYRDSVVTLERYQNARSAYELAKSQKRIADFNLKHSKIKAPSDGKILKILAETKEVIGPGYPVILFASTENDWVVRVSLTDKDIVRLSMGDSARVFMDAFPGMTLRASVSELGTIADPVTGTYETELQIRRSLPQFRTGFFSRAEIYPDGVDSFLVVPLESLMDAGNNSADIFIYKQGKAWKRRIKTGAILQDQVVVLSGLQEGEMVITEGAIYLKDGEMVKTVEPDTSGVPDTSGASDTSGVPDTSVESDWAVAPDRAVELKTSIAP